VSKNAGYVSGRDDARKSDAIQRLVQEAHHAGFEAGKAAAAKAAEMQAAPNTRDTPLLIDE
jgi:hypothetical protein